MAEKKKDKKLGAMIHYSHVKNSIYEDECIFTEVGFLDLTAATMKSTIFWDVTSYNPVDVFRRFGGMHCRHLQIRIVSQEINQQGYFCWSRNILAGLLGVFFYPVVGGSTSLRKVSKRLIDYTTSRPNIPHVFYLLE
jgi:hypothetical protein